MRKASLVFTLVLTMAFLIGCMSVETKVQVNADGSGQIIEKVGLSRGMTDMVSEMAGGDDSQMEEPFSKEDLEKAAEDFGEGVKFVGVLESEGENMKYYEAVYAFEDINKVRIDQNQGNKAPASVGKEEDQRKKEPLKFSLVKGPDSSILKIAFPQEDADGSDPKNKASEKPSKDEMPPEMEEAQLEMMKVMFQGMRFAIVVECGNELVKTNATHADGPAVTLLDLDFAKLMGNQEKLKELNRMEPEGIEETKEILKGIEGIKFEMAEEIWVQFR